MNREEGKIKGFAFVELLYGVNVETVLNQVKGLEMGELRLRIIESKPREVDVGSGGGNSGGFGGENSGGFGGGESGGFGGENSSGFGGRSSDGFGSGRSGGFGGRKNGGFGGYNSDDYYDDW